MANGTSGTRGGNTLQPLGELKGIYGSPLDWIRENTTLDDAVVADTYDAIRKFTGSSSHDIRDSQLKGANDLYGKRGELIENYIKNARPWDNSTPLQRGMIVDPDLIETLKLNMKTGTPFDVNRSGTASWSTDMEVARCFAESYSDQVPVIFRTKKMKNATPIMHLSSLPDEFEVFSSKDNRFKLKKMEKTIVDGKDGWIIDVEQV